MEYKVTIKKNLSISRIAWFWEVSFGGLGASGATFTRLGAIKSAKRFIRSQETNNKQFSFVLKGEK